MRWVSLHNHTTFSYGDGYGPVSDHVARVDDLGMKSVSVTEHGNTSSHAQLEKECLKRGIHPVYGCELYTAPTDVDNDWLSIKTRKKFHLTVLAKNEEGYRNLNRIVSLSWKDNYFQWPTASARMLAEHSEGLVVLSGCSDSLLSCSLLGGKEFGEKRLEYSKADFARAREVIERHQEIFGEDYYLEVQRFPGLDRTRVLNPAFAELSKITGAKLVGTADVHYPFPEDNEMQPILHAAHRGSTVDAVTSSWEYDILLTYPLSDKEIIKDLVATGLTKKEAKDAVYITEKIANECQVILPKNEPIKFPYPGSGLEGEERTYSSRIANRKDYSSVDEYIWDKLREGWDFRAKTYTKMSTSKKHQKKYLDRLHYEMGQIAAKEFNDYFAFLADTVTWAKSNEGIKPSTVKKKIPVGPARGSAAASLAAWLLRITEINPMLFPHMLFERFIDPNRLDLPDVDLDFADDRREEIRMYNVYVYGADRVGNIGNFTRYRGKNSIDDVARAYRIPGFKTKTVKDLIVERSGGDARQSESLSDTFDMFPKAREVLKEYPELRLATRLEGNYRGLGVHAAGLVISNAPITETCATYTRPKAGSAENVTVVAYDKKDSEYLGMLKADFLGLTTMGLVGLAIDSAGMDLDDLYNVPITEKRVLQAFQDNDLHGIFQFSGRATAIVNADVVPKHFGHLADINALSRPGPLFSGMTAQYVNVKHKREKAEKLHPIVDNLTDWTYGQIVYQEQVLAIVRDLAGFPMGRVGDIRRIISQKLGNMAMENAYAEFEKGCWETNGVDAKLARKIWNFIATSSTYSFNQSHSVSYAMLAFWCMYLKVYHPTAFYAATLTKVGDGKDDLYKRGKIMQDAIRHGIDVSPPDMLLSGDNWYADVSAKSVIAGFSQVSGIGPVTSKAIQEWRRERIEVQGRPPSWEDLIEVNGIGPATMKRVVAFTEAEDPFGINTVSDTLDKYRSLIKRKAPGGYGMIPSPTHTSQEMPRLGVHQVVWIGLPRSKNYKDYVEATRTRTGKDVEEILRTMKDPHLVKSCVVQSYDDGDEDVYLRFNRWQFPRFEEALESLNPDTDVVIVRGTKREDFGISIHVQEMFVISQDEEEEEDE